MGVDWITDEISFRVGSYEMINRLTDPVSEYLHSDEEAHMRYMRHICIAYIKHFRCVEEADRAFELIRSLDNRMVLMVRPGESPIMDRIESVPIEPLNKEYLEGSMIRGVLFFRDLEVGDFGWMRDLFRDVSVYLNQRSTEVDESVAELSYHFNRMSGFMGLCRKRGNKVRSDY